MLDLKAVVADFDGFAARLARRGEAAAAALAPVRPLTVRRRELNVLIEKQKKEQGEANAKIRELAKVDKAAVEAKRAELRALGDAVKASEAELTQVEGEISRLLLLVPNPPHASVPAGKDEHDNALVRTWGEKRALGFVFQSFNLLPGLGELGIMGGSYGGYAALAGVAAVVHLAGVAVPVAAPGWARRLRAFNDAMMFDLLGGPRPWRLSWVINAQKAGTFPLLALLMWHYSGRTPAATAPAAWTRFGTSAPRSTGSRASRRLSRVGSVSMAGPMAGTWPTRP